MFSYDSFVNFLSGLGIVGKDKTASGTFIFQALERVELEAAYRGDWIARKVVDIPANDSTREWRTWQASNKQIEAIENEEKRLDVRGKVRRAMLMARLYGGSVLILGVEGKSGEPLMPETLKQGGLQFIHAMHRYEVTAGPMDLDVLSPWYGEPQYYSYTGARGVVFIHPSRVVRMLGNEILDLQQSHDGWGDSVLQTVHDAVRAANTVGGSIAALVNEAKIDIIKIPQFSKQVSTKEYTDKLTTRFTYANSHKSIINALLMDKEEEWQRQSANFAGLPDVYRLYLLVASGAAHIPATVMLGQSPAGLSATGESDVRNYYDRVSSDQNTTLTPTLNRLDELLIMSALGKRDPSIHYEWAPLWQMSETESATVAKAKADTFKVDVETGLFNEDALREMRFNQLVEDGTYPGIEDLDIEPDEDDVSEPGGEVATVPAAGEGDESAEGDEPTEDLDNPEDDDLELDTAWRGDRRPGRRSTLRASIALARQKLWEKERESLERELAAAQAALAGGGAAPHRVRTLKADAQPRTLYVRRDLLNASEVAKWAKEQGLTDLVDDMHVTVIYSREHVDWMKASQPYGQDEKGHLIVAPGGPRVVEKFDQGAVVLLFNHSEISWRHEDLKRMGASHDYDYAPHVTLTYSPGDVDLASIEPYRGRLEFGPEIFEEVK